MGPEMRVVRLSTICKGVADLDRGRMDTRSLLTVVCVTSFLMVSCFYILMKRNMLWSVCEWITIIIGRIAA